MVEFFVKAIRVLASEFYVLILSDFKDLAMMIIVKYSLESFNNPETMSLFNKIHKEKVAIDKMMSLIEEEDGWSNEKIEKNMRIVFKQVIYLII